MRICANGTNPSAGGMSSPLGRTKGDGRGEGTVVVNTFRREEVLYLACNEERAFLLPKNIKNMSLIMRKPVFGVSDQALHKAGCTTAQDG